MLSHVAPAPINAVGLPLARRFDARWSSSPSVPTMK